MPKSPEGGGAAVPRATHAPSSTVGAVLRVGNERPGGGGGAAQLRDGVNALAARAGAATFLAATGRGPSSALLARRAAAAEALAAAFGIRNTERLRARLSRLRKSSTGTGSAAGGERTGGVGDGQLRAGEDYDAAEDGATGTASAQELALSLASWWSPTALPSHTLVSPPADIQLFIAHLVLHSIALNVSLAGTDRVAKASPLSPSSPPSPRKRGGRQSDFDELSGGAGGRGRASALARAAFSTTVNTTLAALGSAALSFQHAPIRLRGLELLNVLAPPAAVVARLGAHYSTSFIGAASLAAGSLDVLGNPVSVRSSQPTRVFPSFRM